MCVPSFLEPTQTREETDAVLRLVWQAVRVAALMRLFRRVEGSPRRFRHNVYARIAGGEPAAWATCGTPPQRDKATKPPGNGSRLHKDVTEPWDRAFAVACDGIAFEKRIGTFADGMSGHIIDDPLMCVVHFETNVVAIAG